MIGDPSGVSEERNLLDAETLAKNLEGITVQLEKLLDFSSGTRIRPAWSTTTRGRRKWGLLDFLRDIGKHVTVNQMVARESVRARMDSDTGISFTEFTYMLLQANDFCWLYEHEQCEMQIGGSDQWGNIVTGIDLIRKRARCHGLRAHLAAPAQGRRHQVRQVRRGSGVARPRPHEPVPVPAVLRAGRRRRRRAPAAAVHPAARRGDRGADGRPPGGCPSGRRGPAAARPRR